MKSAVQKPSPAMIVACLALILSLGPVAYAANTVFSSDIVDGEVKTADIANQAVTNIKLAPNAVGPGRVMNNSLTTLDIKGADVNGLQISIGAGAVTDGQCRDFSISAAGAGVGESVVISTQGALPQGTLIYGVRVPSAGEVTIKICNLSGAVMPAISNLPIRIITLG